MKEGVRTCSSSIGFHFCGKNRSLAGPKLLSLGTAKTLGDSLVKSALQRIYMEVAFFFFSAGMRLAHPFISQNLCFRKILILHRDFVIFMQ